MSLSLEFDNLWGISKNSAFRYGKTGVSKRFADIARLCVADMLRVLEAGEGRKIYVDYVAVTQNYLIPFFGKFNIANIGYKQVHAYEQWRREKFGRELKASTVNTHNSALNRIFDEAIARGYMQKSHLPVLSNKGGASMRRADFGRQEYAQIPPIPGPVLLAWTPSASIMSWTGGVSSSSPGSSRVFPHASMKRRHCCLTDNAPRVIAPDGSEAPSDAFVTSRPPAPARHPASPRWARPDPFPSELRCTGAPGFSAS